MLIDISFKSAKIPQKGKDKLKELIMDIVNVISIEISKVGFWGNAQKEKHLRAIIDDMLLYSEIGQLVDNKAKIVSDFMKLAKNRSEELKV